MAHAPPATSAARAAERRATSLPCESCAGATACTPQELLPLPPLDPASGCAPRLLVHRPREWTCLCILWSDEEEDEISIRGSLVFFPYVFTNFVFFLIYLFHAHLTGIQTRGKHNIHLRIARTKSESKKTRAKS